MIHGAKENASTPRTLVEENGEGKNETREAVAFYKDPRNKDKPFKFKAFVKRGQIDDELLREYAQEYKARNKTAFIAWVLLVGLMAIILVWTVIANLR